MTDDWHRDWQHQEHAARFDENGLQDRVEVDSVALSNRTGISRRDNEMWARQS